MVVLTKKTSKENWKDIENLPRGCENNIYSGTPFDVKKEK